MRALAGKTRLGRSRAAGCVFATTVFSDKIFARSLDSWDVRLRRERASPIKYGQTCPEPAEITREHRSDASRPRLVLLPNHGCRSVDGNRRRTAVWITQVPFSQSLTKTSRDVKTFPTLFPITAGCRDVTAVDRTIWHTGVDARRRLYDGRREFGDFALPCDDGPVTIRFRIFTQEFLG